MNLIGPVQDKAGMGLGEYRGESKRFFPSRNQEKRGREEEPERVGKKSPLTCRPSSLRPGMG